MCRTPKNPFHPDGCRCTECGRRARELEMALNSGVGAPLPPTPGAWLDRRHKVMDKVMRSPMMVLEDLTPGGSEYVGNPERCAEYVEDLLDRQHRTILRLTYHRKHLREFAERCRKQIVCCTDDTPEGGAEDCLHCAAQVALDAANEAAVPSPITVDYNLLDEQIKVVARKLDSASGDYEIDALTAVIELLSSIHEQRPFPESKEPQETGEQI